MLNNKGQTLALFVIVLPVLLLILILVIDFGKIMTLKQELTNISNIVLDYGLDNLDKENLDIELVELIKLNKSDIDYMNVYLEKDKIYVEMSENSDSVFAEIVDISIFKVKTSYVGYIKDNKKRIERMGD